MECPRLYQFQGRRGRGKGYHKNGCAANPHSLQGQQQLFVQLPLLIYRSLQNSHEAWRSLAISFCVGLVLLAAWFVLRKERYAADQAIAKVTFHIWTELRFLVVFLCLLCLTVPMLAAADGYNWWYPDDVSYTIMQTLRCFGAGLFNPGAALGLFWAVWFIRNDHRYHPAETRKSLYRTVSSAMRKMN